MAKKRIIGNSMEFFMKSLLNLAGLIFGLFLTMAGARSTPPGSWIGVILGIFLMLGAARELKTDLVEFRSKLNRQ
ncbi:MAG: hypothetical protein Q8P76_02085 [bacterium]|nr:hypothetical protein [bacterium]